jgi:hypothetical protein
MEKNIYDGKPEIYLYKLRLAVNIITIGIGLIVSIYTLFVSYDINSLILFRSCGALLILAGLWHGIFVKLTPLLCSIISWILTWLAYFMAYDDLALRMWCYIFVGIGSFYLTIASLEFVNRKLEKEFGSKKNENITEFSKNKSEKSKSIKYITISSIFCVLLFIGILSYYILSSYRSIK